MSKKILVVGAGTSQMNAIKHATDLGYEVFIMDGDPCAPGLNLGKDFKIDDIKNADKIIEVATKFQVDGITSFSTDIPITAISDAVSKLDLSGISSEQARLSVNKYLQRQMLLEFNIPSPKFFLFSSSQEGLEILDALDNPAVIKPIDSSGSRGVRFSSSNMEKNKKYCSEALKLSPTNSGIIEAFIPGPEIAVDGFVVEGEIKILSICDKTRSKPPYLLDTELLFPSQIPSLIKDQVEELAKKIIQASKIQDSPFHIEMIISDQGPILVEFGARGPGFNVYDLIIPFISGIDTVQTQIKQCLGEEVQIKNILNKSAFLYFLSSSKNGVLTNIKEVDQIKSIDGVAEFKMFLKPGDKVQKLKSGSDRIGFILVLTAKLNKSLEIKNQIKNKLEIAVN